MEQKQTTNDEILSAINDFATKTEERFQGIDKRFDGIDGRLGTIESTMVTKDFLTEKLADMKGDIITVVRKEDTKVVALINKMREKNSLTAEETKELLTMEPFPDLRASLSL